MSAHGSSLAARRLGSLGAGLSAACVVHCLAAPLLVAALPLAGLEALADHPADSYLWAASVAFSTSALCWGYRVHRRRRVFALLAATLVILALGRLAPRAAGETGLAVTAALMLAASHFLNDRLCRTCSHCHDGDDGHGSH